MSACVRACVFVSVCACVRVYVCVYMFVCVKTFFQTPAHIFERNFLCWPDFIMNSSPSINIFSSVLNLLYSTSVILHYENVRQIFWGDML